MTGEATWTCRKCNAPVAGPYARCARCGDAPFRTQEHCPECGSPTIVDGRCTTCNTELKGVRDA